MSVRLDSPASSKDGAGKEYYQCSVTSCGKIFKRKHQVRIHMRRHTGETAYTCSVPECGQKYKWRSSMFWHYKAHERKGEIQAGIAIIQDRNVALHRLRKSAAVTCPCICWTADVETGSNSAKADDSLSAGQSALDAITDQRDNDPVDPISAWKKVTRASEKPEDATASGKVQLPVKRAESGIALGASVPGAEKDNARDHKVAREPLQDPVLTESIDKTHNRDPSSVPFTTAVDSYDEASRFFPFVEHLPPFSELQDFLDEES